MRRIFALGTALLAVGCAAETSSPVVPDHFEVVQAPPAGTPGRPLDSLLLLRLVDAQGAPISGLTVAWHVIAGGGTVGVITAVTGADGIVAAQWTLGLAYGEQQIQVVAEGGPALTVTVTATGLAATALGIGNGFGCALDSLGAAWCWGVLRAWPANKSFGARPVKVDSGHALTEIVAGPSHACATNEAGAVRCWGSERYLGRGNGTTIQYLDPAPVAGGLDLRWLASGGSGTCGIDPAGKGWCWGNGGLGALGSAVAWLTGALTPTAIEQGGLSFEQISLGYEHGCALDTAGAAWCWGRNDHWQLGDSTLGGTSLAPRAVTGGRTYDEIAVSAYFSCANNGTSGLWCWGEDYYSSTPLLGRRFGSPALVSPAPIRAMAGTGSSGMVVGLVTGRPYSWGVFDVYGQGFGPGAPSPLPGELYAVRSMSATNYTVCALRADGAILCWGYVPTTGANGEDDGQMHADPVAIPAP
jgi:Regulator of Chromosome Condensation (RCC1) repeat protein